MKKTTVLLVLIVFLSSLFAMVGEVHAAVTFTAPELLARPTDHSVTVNVVASQNIEAYFQYDTASGVYTNQTSTATSTGGTPLQVVIDGLSANTRYYYRMVYREVGTTDWIYRDEHSFYTQRAPSSTFTFTIISDSHMNGGGGSVSLYQQTLNNVLADHPDFHLDLGDTFWMDGVTSSTVANQRYLNQRQYMGTISPSVPIFVPVGNHEDEEAWHLDDTGNPATSPPVLSANARKKYFPNPVPDSFYTGNTDPYSYLDGDHLREDYYAWTWGDALFVVIDPYWYTTTKPYIGNAGGGESSDVGSGDRWDWTLGLQQFNWLKQTLENSTAKYKFIFDHHQLGGAEDYVRGGANYANLVEWGGYNEDGTTWGWDVKRPVAQWGSKPIHQLMVDNHVTAYFHGHDHLYAYEARDGIVYQSVPSAAISGSGLSTYYNNKPYTIKVLPSPGHLRVTVSPSQVTVDYVATSSGTVNYSYTITAANPGTITVNDFDSYRVFQRDIGGTSKSITISGTYANMDWSRVEARILKYGTNTVVVDWTTIDTTPGGGTFSGNLTVPQGGWYNVEVRALDSGGIVLGSSRGINKWGVGMIILCIGQSNMSGHGEKPFTVANSDLAVTYSNAGVWEHLADPYDDDSPAGAVDNDNTTAAGSMIPALANSLLQTFNFPIAFVPSAKDGTNLYSQWSYRNPSNHYDTSTLYGQSITKARSVGGVELIIMHQGEADTNAHRTEAQYEADFATLISHYREDLYTTIPIFICQLGTITLGTNTRTDVDVQAVRNAQHDLDNGVNIFMAATAMDQPRLDAVHYTTQGLNAIGGRVAQAIKYYFGVASYYRGPAITSATFAGNRSTIDVYIAHRGGNDFTPTSGITGFSVLSHGASVSITSAQRNDSDTVRLTLASDAPQGATVTLRYLWGSEPNTTGLIKDNSSLMLPLENTALDVTVIDTNSPPVAVNDAYSTNEDTALSVAAPGVLSNDSDANGNSLTAVWVSNPAHGSLVFNTDGSFSYTPAANYNGNDSFTYKANDGQADSNASSVSITVNAVNDAPVANAQSVTTIQNTAKAITLTANDVDGNTLIYSIVSFPTHGTLSGTLPNVTYTPITNYNGSDSFTFKANDGVVDSNIATVSIAVSPPASSSNLALNKTATADSQQTSLRNTAGKGNDGNSSTRWCANDGRWNHWWKVDLGTSYTLTGTKVRFQYARNYRYKIEVSTDNINWTIVANRTTTTSTAQTRQDSFSTTGRYVRITYTGLPWYPATWASHYEFEVYGY
jgi:VCBS repeat-containing protein